MTLGSLRQTLSQDKQPAAYIVLALSRERLTHSVNHLMDKTPRMHPTTNLCAQASIAAWNVSMKRYGTGIGTAISIDPSAAIE